MEMTRSDQLEAPLCLVEAENGLTIGILLPDLPLSLFGIRLPQPSSMKLMLPDLRQHGLFRSEPLS